MSFLLTITLAAVGAVAVIAGPADAGPGARAANFTPPPLPPPMLTANARFEAARFSGEISAWACDNRTAPVPTGHPERGWVLSGSPTATAASGCAQPIPVTPNSSYWLTFASRGGPVEVVAGEHRATAPASREWAWTRMEFTTGPTTTDLLLSVRGVPGGGAFMADDIVLQGSASPDHVPATPTGVVISERTSSSFQVAWTGSPGTTQYLVYVRTPDGELYAVGTRYMSTDALERSRVEFLEPDTAYDVTVTALGPAGVSAPSASVAARTVAASAAPPPRVRS
ncbi:MAG TPA: fibronectin type III domain-containing protein, partial [Micromonosporaceae bacterium]|nr:fibronectin type III domain-containing protein [Micromonosporaceae bacterium]